MPRKKAVADAEVNSEQQIQSRINALKEEKEAVDSLRESYKELTKEIKIAVEEMEELAQLLAEEAQEPSYLDIVDGDEGGLPKEEEEESAYGMLKNIKRKKNEPAGLMSISSLPIRISEDIEIRTGHPGLPWKHKSFNEFYK